VLQAGDNVSLPCEVCSRSPIFARQHPLANGRFCSIDCQKTSPGFTHVRRKNAWTAKPWQQKENPPSPPPGSEPPSPVHKRQVPGPKPGAKKEVKQGSANGASGKYDPIKNQRAAKRHKPTKPGDSDGSKGGEKAQHQPRPAQQQQCLKHEHCVASDAEWSDGDCWRADTGYSATREADRPVFIPGQVRVFLSWTHI
jgi:hypothetical protein